MLSLYHWDVFRSHRYDLTFLFQVHARNKGFNSEEEKEELLKEIAQQTYEFSGAELQNVL